MIALRLVRNVTIAALAVTLFAGCQVEEDPSMVADPNAAPAPATTKPAPETERGRSTATSTGASSTLGKAKQSATNTVNDLERRQRELSGQFDEENE